MCSQMSHFLRLRIWIIVFLFALQLALAQSALHGADTSSRTHRILLLNSYHQNFQWTDDLVGAAIRTISQSLPNAEIFVEYMDRKRFPGNERDEEIIRFLETKYRNNKPEVIITSDDAALSMMKKYRDEIFPGVPVVFCGVNNVEQTFSLPSRFAGLIENVDIQDNLALIKKLFPKTRQVAVVTDGATTGMGTRQEILRASASFPGLRFLYLNGEDLTTEEMLDKLRKLSPDSVAIAPAWYIDKAGKTFTNTEIYPLIAEASPVPVIATSSANLGLGLFGGRVNSGQTQGDYAGALAVKILNGTSTTNDLRVQTSSRNAYAFDHRQMLRFGISPHQLPPNSQIAYRTYSFYEMYRDLVLGVTALFCLFTGLIVMLSIIVHRLRLTRSELASNEENLRITLNCIGDAVISTDTNTNVYCLNPVAECLTGWSQKDAAGKPLDEVFRAVNSQTRTMIDNPARQALHSGTALTLQKSTILIARDGSERYIADSCAPIRNANAFITGAVLVFRDITEDVLVEEKLRHSQKMDAIGQLAGGVAHDFNNMLGGIMGSAEVLASKIGPVDENHCYVDMIIKAAEKASALTDKLLAFSRKGKILSTAIDTHSCLQDVLAILEHTLDKNVTIIHELEAQKTVIVGDPSQIQNAIINLGLNAEHAMPGGGTLTISTTDAHLDKEFCNNPAFRLTPGDYIRICVRDTGTGIAPEVQPHIFEPFFTTKEVGKGTGLGLSAVYGTMKDHNGCVTLFSTPGEGSSFYLYFPIAEGATVHKAIAPAAPTHTGGRRILVIDDEPIIRTTALNLLEDLGYTVILATNGDEGLRIFRERHNEIDLVLLDMVMPGISGVECFHKLCKIDSRARVVASSGFAREGSLREMQAMGIASFIKKPYRRADLAKIINEVLQEDSQP